MTVTEAPGALRDLVTVVIVTKDRRAALLRTLRELSRSPDGPRIIVVDNGSSDGTASAVRASFPEVHVMTLSRNRGAAARNDGVRVATTPFVAFNDDDSWWAGGSLEHAVHALLRFPEAALVSARVLVGREQRVDTTSTAMASSPLRGVVGARSPGVLGFLACAAVVRRQPFLDAGGFDDLLFFLGEEEKLSYDLSARGWALLHLDEAVVRHLPDEPRDPVRRQALQQRNALLTAVMRRP
jgi:GT2 family glycosyltransferase